MELLDARKLRATTQRWANKQGYVPNKIKRPSTWYPKKAKAVMEVLQDPREHFGCQTRRVYEFLKVFTGLRLPPLRNKHGIEGKPQTVWNKDAKFPTTHKHGGNLTTSILVTLEFNHLRHGIEAGTTVLFNKTSHGGDQRANNPLTSDGTRHYGYVDIRELRPATPDECKQFCEAFNAATIAKQKAAEQRAKNRERGFKAAETRRKNAAAKKLNGDVTTKAEAKKSRRHQVSIGYEMLHDF